MNRTALIRQWWYLYANWLRNHNNKTAQKEFMDHDSVVTAAGIETPGRPMTRQGAEDLADICDRLRHPLLS